MNEVSLNVSGGGVLIYRVEERDPFISKELYLFIMSISLGSVCQTITLFGTITNVLSIIVFTRQGFAETMNISLISLTLSDLSSVLSMMWANICYSKHFRIYATNFDPEDVQLLTGGWPHVIFSRTTGWITAFISFERCVCVIFPLKVKSIFTRRKHITIMITIFIVTISGASLVYVEAGLGWKYFTDRNKTLVGVVYHFDENVQIIINSVAYGVNGVFMPITSFMTVVVCTVILIIKLKQNTAWRESHSTSENQPKQAKNQRVAKMVVTLSVIFIVSFIPAVITFIAGCFEPELSYFGRYKHIFMITLSISFIAEVINSSTNIFVYLAMSTKYNDTFLKLFSRASLQRLLY